MHMKVKIFDEEHERDLEVAINAFLKGIAAVDVLDVKYQLSHFSDGPGQIYSYSALVLYKYRD